MFIKDKGYMVVNSVRAVRTSLKMTQNELAEKVQATRQTIIAIEKGNYAPSVLLALRIAHVLGSKVEDLFQYEKYKLLLDVVLLGGLTVMSLLAIAPHTFVMPTSAQILLLAVILGLLATFLVFCGAKILAMNAKLITRRLPAGQLISWVQAY